MYKVEIEWFDGTNYAWEIYTPLDRLISVSELTRQIRVDKEFEATTCTIILVDDNGYFTDPQIGIMAKYPYTKDIKMIVKDDDIVIFTGRIQSLPSADIGQFSITATLQSQGLQEEINKQITLEGFPGYSEGYGVSGIPGNIGKYGNYIFGKNSDEALKTNQEGGTPTGSLVAYRVGEYSDGDGMYLAAWHHLWGLISCYRQQTEEDITEDCVLDNNTGSGYTGYSGMAFIKYSGYTIPENDTELYFNCSGYCGIIGENPADILETLNALKDNPFTIEGISGYCGWAGARVEYSNINRNYTKSAVVINDNIKWSEFLSQFSKNFDNQLFFDASGKLILSILQWGYDYSTVPKITPAHIVEKTYKNYKDIESIVNTYRRKYWYNFRQNQALRQPGDIVLFHQNGRG